MKTKRHGQLETFTNYGWTLAIIVLIVAVAWYVGMFNPEKTPPKKQCGGFDAFTCIDYNETYTPVSAQIYVTFGNAAGRKITVTSITIGASTNAASITLNPNEQATLTANTSASYGEPKDRNYDVTIIYTDSFSGLAHTDTGFLSVSNQWRAENTAPPNSVTACRAINTGGYYSLTKNINTSANCMNINATGVNFDCAGYKITSNNPAAYQAFYSPAGKDLNGLTLKNCIIENFSYAVYTPAKIKNSLFQNNRVLRGTNATAYGFYSAQAIESTIFKSNTFYAYPAYTAFYPIRTCTVANCNFTSVTADSNNFTNTGNALTFYTAYKLTLNRNYYSFAAAARYVFTTANTVTQAVATGETIAAPADNGLNYGYYAYNMYDSTFDGNTFANPYYAVQNYYSNNLAIRNNAATGNCGAGYPFMLRTSSSNVAFENNAVNCSVAKGTTLFYSTAGANASIRNNAVSNCTTGFLVRIANATIYNNYASLFSSAGFNINTNATNAVLDSNTATNATVNASVYGYYFYNATSALVTNNRAQNCYYGFFLTNTTNSFSQFKYNYGLNNSYMFYASGINNVNVTAYNNTAVNSTVRGMYFAGSLSLLNFSNNYACDTAANAFYLTGVSAVYADGGNACKANRCYQSAAYGVCVPNTAGNRNCSIIC